MLLIGLLRASAKLAQIAEKNSGTSIKYVEKIENNPVLFYFFLFLLLSEFHYYLGVLELHLAQYLHDLGIDILSA